MWWESYLTLQAVRMLKWEILAYNFLCLHSQIRATHWIYFLCQVSQSQRCFFFLLWFALTIYSPESFMGSSALQYEVEWVPFTFHSMWGVKKSKWMLVNNNMLSHYFLFWRIQKKKMQKCCECMIESVTCRTAHFWQFCLPKEYNCIEDRREICCIVYKVMFIQYFNITSDFRGCYLNRILYLHVKCQQQFIDIVLPFIIRVLIVFLIFV